MATDVSSKIAKLTSRIESTFEIKLAYPVHQVDGEQEALYYPLDVYHPVTI